MATDMKRITILLPGDLYDRLVAISEDRRESMSNIGRRLFREWLEAQEPTPPKPGPKQK